VSAQSRRAAPATLVLLTLATGQFLMTLDSSVMNVSIATVAKDVGTTVTGIQGAITAYTLVMAALMITGAKVGAMIGRKRAFAIGCVIYGCGSLTTALAPNLPVLLLGWSFLEGVGAALILPAIVALVAGNFATERRPAAYGMVAAAGAIAKTVEASGASAETARAVGESEAAKLASMAPEGAVSGNLPGVVKASEGGFYGPLGNRSGPGPNGPYPPAQPLQRPTIITPYGKVMPPAELPPLPGAPAAPESFYGPMGNRGGPGPQPWADPGVMDPSRIATGYPNASPVPTGVPLQRPNIPTPYGKVMPPSELPPLPGAPTKVDEIIGTVTKFRAANMDRGQIIKALKNGPMSEASLPEIGRVVDQIQKGNVVLPPYRGGPAQPGPMATAPEDIMARLQDSLAAYRTP
jgi:hypothetical protein